MKVFSVVMMDDYIKRLCIEHYSTLELALTQACEWCRDIYSVNGNRNPQPQDCGDGRTIEYIVYRGEEGDVNISVIELEIMTAIPYSITMSGDLTGSTSSDQPITMIATATLDDPNDSSLPAGWLHDGTPVRMDVLMDAPESMVPVDNLTREQQFALAIARISKRPQFSFVTDLGVFIQSSALQELKKKTSIGFQIMEEDILTN